MLRTAVLNNDHQRRLRTTFERVDGLLADAVVRLGQTDNGSPFRITIPDATPSQRRAASEYLELLRQAMHRFLDRQGIPIEPPAVSGLWNLRVAIEFARIDLEEIEPHRLASYGALGADAQTVVEGMLADLQTILGELSRYVEGILAGSSQQGRRKHEC